MANKKKHRVTKEREAEVTKYVAVGVDEFTISAIMGIDVETLRANYAVPLSTAQAKANTTIAAKVYDQATKGCRQSQRLWLTTQAAWTPKSEVEYINRNIPVDDDDKDKKPAESIEDAKREWERQCEKHGMPKISH